jgi:hypothetical protein
MARFSQKIALRGQIECLKLNPFHAYSFWCDWSVYNWMIHARYVQILGDEIELILFL